MTSYNCVSIIAVCKRCTVNFVTLSKREPALVDNDGDNSDDGNEGDDDDNDKSDEDQEVFIAAEHLVLEKGKEMIKSCAVRLRQWGPLCINQFQRCPCPLGQPRGICSRCQSWGWGISKFYRGPGPGH